MVGTEAHDWIPRMIERERIPWVVYPYFLTAFFLLFLYKENIHQLSFLQMLIPLFISLVGLVSFHALFSFLLSNSLAAGALTAVTATFFFNFGRIMDMRDAPPHLAPWLWKGGLLLLFIFLLFLAYLFGKRWKLNAFFTSRAVWVSLLSASLFFFLFRKKIIFYLQNFHPLHVLYFLTDRPIFILFFMLVSISLFFLLLKQKIISVASWTKYLNFFSYILLGVVFVQIASYHFLLSSPNERSSETIFSLFLDTQTSLSGELPDIYYIILDGYAGEKTLQEAYFFDNSPFLRALEKKGFYVAPESKANYLITFLSLTSSLNMAYLDPLVEVVGKNSRDRTLPYALMDDNQVLRFLHSQGYRSYHFSSGWAATEDNPFAEKVFDHFKTSELGFLLLRSTPLRLLTPNERAVTLLYAFDKLKEMPSLPGPKFIFAHIEAPHPPYVFDAEGNIISDDPYDPSGKQWVDKQGYINQLQFTNKKTLEIVDALLEESEHHPIIIIHGDHGVDTRLDWVNHPTQQRLEERSHIFNAYFLPGSPRGLLYPTISPVNSFRLIFNAYFQQQLPLLDDNTYFSDHYQTPYNFTLVYRNGEYVGPYPEENSPKRSEERKVSLFLQPKSLFHNLFNG